MRKKVRKWIFAALRLAVCAGALAWVLSNVVYHDYVTLDDGRRLRVVDVASDEIAALAEDGSRIAIPCGEGGCERDARLTRGLKTTWQGADKSLLVICCLVFAPVSLIQSWRFQLMLRAQEIPISFWESCKLCYAGNFLNFVTALGSTGGDVFKMYYASLHTERKTEAVVTVFLDRVVGLFGLVFLVACALVMRMGDSKLGVLAFGVAVIAAGGLLAGAVLFSDRVRSLIRPQHVLARLPFAAHFQRAESATRRLGQHKGLVMLALGLTVLLQGIAMTAFIFAALALGMRGDAAAICDYYAYFPAGLVVAAIPISFMGLGTMEAFFKHALMGTHGSLSALLCLAMIVRLVTLLWALPGVIVTLTGAYRPSIGEEQVQFAQTDSPIQESRSLRHPPGMQSK